MGTGHPARTVHPAALAGLAALALVAALVAVVLSLNEPPPAPAVRLLPPLRPAAVHGESVNDPVAVPGQPPPVAVPGQPWPAAASSAGSVVPQPPLRPRAAVTANVAVPLPVRPEQLSPGRPRAAATFLEAVQLAAHPRGGYVVLAVLAESRPARMGLRPGDRLYALDTPRMAAIDEQSMVALMLQTEFELDIYRDGVPMRLALALNHDEADDDDARRSPTETAGR